MNCTDHESNDPRNDPELPPPGRRPNARYARKAPIPAPLIKAVTLATFHSRAVMLSARSAPGIEDALCDVSRKAKCIQ